MKSNCKILGLLVSVMLIVASCRSPEERIEAEYNTFSLPNSTLLYEYIDTYSGATESCSGMFIDRWYGSEATYDDLTTILEDQLSTRGWVLWPEDVVRIWRKQTQTGLFGLSMLALTGEEVTNPRGLYELPTSFFHETANYSTVYVISLTYMDASHVKRCFGK